MTVLPFGKSWKLLLALRSSFSLIIICILFATANAEGNVTCAGPALDWYTTRVGETPCKTYERLRQICNPQFEVGAMNTALPPDGCNEQLSECCCHSIAFSLSMLCLNCQQNIGTGSGFDAGNGVYQRYLQGIRQSGTCSPVQNLSLPVVIQSAVCNNEIKIFNNLYGLFWTSGSCKILEGIDLVRANFVDSIYTYETITTSIASTDNDAFTRCNSTTVNASSSSDIITVESTVTLTLLPAISTHASSNGDTLPPRSSLSGAAISGIVAGAVGGLIVLVVLGLLAWNRKKPVPPVIEPFRGFNYGHLGSSSNLADKGLSGGGGINDVSGAYGRPAKMGKVVEERNPQSHGVGGQLLPKKLLDSRAPADKAQRRPIRDIVKKSRVEEYKIYVKSLLPLAADYIPPIHRLPNELLLTIFELSSSSNELRFRKSACSKASSPGVSPKFPQLPTLAISNVCTRWRGLALGTSNLWSQLKLEFIESELEPSLYDGLISMLQLYLSRSRSAPLYLQVNIRINKSHHTPKGPFVYALVLLFKHHNRWRSFKLDSKHKLQLHRIEAIRAVSFPILEEMTITYPNSLISTQDLNLFTQAPLLRRFHTPDFRMKSSFPWRQLTCLDIHAPDAASIFRHCPSLVTLKLRSPAGWIAYKEPAISLNNLRSLTLVVKLAPEEFLECVFSIFTTPALVELVVDTDEQPKDEDKNNKETRLALWPALAFDTFLSRSAFRLEMLSIRRVKISDKELIDALWKMPSIVDFGIDDGDVKPSPISPELIWSLHSLQTVLKSRYQSQEQEVVIIVPASSGSDSISAKLKPEPEPVEPVESTSASKFETQVAESTSDFGKDSDMVPILASPSQTWQTTRLYLPPPPPPGLLPNLRRLSMKVNGSYFNDTLFVRMVLSRWLPQTTSTSPVDLSGGMDHSSLGTTSVAVVRGDTRPGLEPGQFLEVDLRFQTRKLKRGIYAPLLALGRGELGVDEFSTSGVRMYVMYIYVYKLFLLLEIEYFSFCRLGCGREGVTSHDASHWLTCLAEFSSMIKLRGVTVTFLSPAMSSSKSMTTYQQSSTSVSLVLAESSARTVSSYLHTNIPPDDKEIAQFSQVLNESLERREWLDNDLRYLESAILRCRQERQHLAQVIHEHKVVLSPVRRLPTELIVEIIYHILGNEELDDILDLSRGLWPLSQVCGSWRAAILGHNSFWTTVYLPWRIDYPHYAVHILSLFLERSGDKPLAVDFSCRDGNGASHINEFTRTLLGVLLAQSHRWETCRLAVPAGVLKHLAASRIARTSPIIRSFDLTLELAFGARPAELYEIFAEAKELRRVKLSGIPIIHTGLRLPWTQLTTYDAFQEFPENHLATLKLMTSLVECRLVSTRHWHRIPRTDSDASVVKLPKLKKMELVGKAGLLLQFLHAPGLKALSVTGSQNDGDPVANANANLHGALANLINANTNLQTIVGLLPPNLVPNANANANMNTEPGTLLRSFLDRSRCRLVELELESVPLVESVLSVLKHKSVEESLQKLVLSLTLKGLGSLSGNGNGGGGGGGSEGASGVFRDLLEVLKYSRRDADSGGGNDEEEGRNHAVFLTNLEELEFSIYRSWNDDLCARELVGMVLSRWALPGSGPGSGLGSSLSSGQGYRQWKRLKKFVLETNTEWLPEFDALEEARKEGLDICLDLR
ncbi:hypothetical protein D9757_001122 [Collybiopsis confluens]|uniref:F-box domain-containing protein n=1 Tax=Collybiopsis confluens TaxID=2823264 RepID=A0A8H5MGD3_9AGAR|nr:hypothetical protein D9757_001122 [Collybiopsis confluens]